MLSSSALGVQTLLVMADDPAAVNVAFLSLAGCVQGGQVELLHIIAAIRPEEWDEDAPYDARRGPLFAWIVLCLTTHKHDAAVQVMGLLVLDMCLHPDGSRAHGRRELAMASNVLVAVLHGMRAHEADPEVQKAGCGALHALLFGDSLGASVPGLVRAAQEGAHEVVARAIAAHHGHPLDRVPHCTHGRGSTTGEIDQLIYSIDWNGSLSMATP
eukprot:4909505-Prymnesium_polylepis.1